MRVAVLGGTGNLGHALARRWVHAGQAVVIGSRDPEKAKATAAALGAGVHGAGNLEAAEESDVVVLTVPFGSQAAVLSEVGDALAGKVLVDTTVPLLPPRVARVQLPVEGSAAERAAQIVGDKVKVVSAFHNVSAHLLAKSETVDCDVLVFGDDKAARQVAVDLADAAGLRGLHGGSLANSAAAEAMTSVLIFLNRQFGGHAGVRLTGLSPDSE